MLKAEEALKDLKEGTFVSVSLGAGGKVIGVGVVAALPGQSAPPKDTPKPPTAVVKAPAAPPAHAQTAAVPSSAPRTAQAASPVVLRDVTISVAPQQVPDTTGAAPALDVPARTLAFRNGDILRV